MLSIVFQCSKKWLCCAYFFILKRSYPHLPRKRGVFFYLGIAIFALVIRQIKNLILPGSFSASSFSACPVKPIFSRQFWQYPTQYFILPSSINILPNPAGRPFLVIIALIISPLFPPASGIFYLPLPHSLCQVKLAEEYINSLNLRGYKAILLHHFFLKTQKPPESCLCIFYFDCDYFPNKKPR